MNPTRRREIRSARRVRRQHGGEDGDIGGVASGAAGAPDVKETAAAATTQAGVMSGRRARSVVAMTADDASRLAERMQRQRQDKTRAGQMLSEREALIQQRYAPDALRFLSEQRGTSTTATTATAAAPFDKDLLLADLIGTRHGNFLSLDRDLTEDHTIATQRLHSAVFAHANSFLLLFRDVDRAGDLVEALKANVQGTKAAISAISKFSSANIVPTAAPNTTGVSSGWRSGGDGSNTAFSSLGSTTAAGSDQGYEVRPSLISSKAYRRHDGDAGARAGDFSRLSTASSRFSTARSTFEEISRGGGVSSRSETSSEASRPTTRSLTVLSVRQWRYRTGVTTRSAAALSSYGNATGSSADRGTGKRLRRTVGSAMPSSAGKGGTDVYSPAQTAEKEAADMMALASILREEVNQLLSERRYMEAAELLCRVSDEAVKNGCLPLLLDLEAAVVRSVVGSIWHIPVTPVYVESLHVPLIQLLLRLGRSRTAASLYLTMQTPWLHAEVQKLQSRVNPQYASLIAVDYLVCTMREAVKRQQLLGLPLEAALSAMYPDSKGRAAAGVGAGAALEATSKTMMSNSSSSLLEKGRQYDIRSVSKRQADGGGSRGKSATVPTTSSVPPAAVILPNSSALLWVRDNAERFARDVLATHILSYGTGTDGGDPTRIRRAAHMMAQSSRVMQSLSTDGFAGCDTLVLRHLTPSLVLLEDDFTRLTVERLEHAGRAMAEQLIASCLTIYDSASSARGGTPGENPSVQMRRPTAAAVYTPSSSDDVARKVQLQCQGLLRLFNAVPPSAHTCLIQLLLAPASARMFCGTTGSSKSTSNQASMTHRRQASLSTTGGGSATMLSSASHMINVAAAGPAAVQLSPELYRFLRYANGCSTVHVQLLQSICSYVAALTGGDQLPASTTASTTEAASAGGAAEAMLVKQTECVASLLTTALITESVDAVLCSLFMSFIKVSLQQRQTIIHFLTSEAFMRNQVAAFGATVTEGADSIAPFFSQPALAPAWVLDSMLALLADVLSTGVWVSFFARGAAMSHLLADPQLGFRTQHLARVQRVMPQLVQGWLAATILLSSDARNAKGILAPTVPLPTPSGAGRQFTTPSTSPVQPLPQRGGHMRSRTASSDASMTASPFGSQVPTGRLTPAAASPRAPSMSTTSKKPEVMDAASSAVLLSVPIKNGEADVMAASVNGSAGSHTTRLSSLFPGAGIHEEPLLKFLMTFLDRKFDTPGTYMCHRYTVTSSETGAATGSTKANPSSLEAVWPVRVLIPSYPEFPIGDLGDHRNDEVFLLHWCTQISLHLITFFQERLLTPSYTMNQHSTEMRPTVGGGSSAAAASSFPIRGCVSPQEDTVLAGLCAGGGNYVAAVAILQYLVMRLLRDGLCRVETWGAVYDCPAATWRADEAVLRQQLFFFSLFTYLWSPLFTGGGSTRRGGGRLRQSQTTSTTAAPKPGQASAGDSMLPSSVDADLAVSANNVDGLPSLTVLEWLTCGGVLQSSDAANGASAVVLPAPPPGGAAIIPRGFTAVDVLFATEGTISVAQRMPSSAAGLASSSNGQPSRGGAPTVSWKVKGPSPSAASAAAGGCGNPVTTYATLAQWELFQSTAYIPDGLLRVVRRFFEEQLGETRAIPAMTSEVMRTRVGRAMNDINLADFVGVSLGDDEDSEDDTAAALSTAKSSSASRSGARKSSDRKVTLKNIRDLIAFYVRPVC